MLLAEPMWRQQAATGRLGRIEWAHSELRMPHAEFVASSHESHVKHLSLVQNPCAGESRVREAGAALTLRG